MTRDKQVTRINIARIWCIALLLLYSSAYLHAKNIFYVNTTQLAVQLSVQYRSAVSCSHFLLNQRLEPGEIFTHDAGYFEVDHMTGIVEVPNNPQPLFLQVGPGANRGMFLIRAIGTRYEFAGPFQSQAQCENSIFIVNAKRSSISYAVTYYARYLQASNDCTTDYGTVQSGQIQQIDVGLCLPYMIAEYAIAGTSIVFPGITSGFFVFRPLVGSTTNETEIIGPLIE